MKYTYEKRNLWNLSFFSMPAFFNTFYPLRSKQIYTYYFSMKPTDALVFKFILVQNYTFRAVPLPVIRSYPLYIRHWHMLYRVDDNLGARSGWNCSSILILHASCITWASAECTAANSWWWVEELPETCRVFWNSYHQQMHPVNTHIKC